MASGLKRMRTGPKRTARPSVREVCLIGAPAGAAGDRLVVGGREYEVVGAPGAYLYLRPAGRGSGLDGERSSSRT